MQTAMELLRSIRLKQWSKNLIFFAALLFSKNVMHLPMAVRTLAGFCILCGITAATYLFNDIVDRERDRHHPEKSRRPIASGRLPVPVAVAAAITTVSLCIAAAWPLSPLFAGVIVIYVALQIAYTLVLKHVVILDVLSITTGFVLRVLAGAVIIGVGISSWLLICTFLLALFLALCKRRHELELLQEHAGAHRRVLSEYSTPLLDQMISVTTASTVIAYTLYTQSEQTVVKFGTTHLVYTVPFVVYGIFRYLYLVHIRKAGGSPESLLIHDLPLVSAIAFWAVASGCIIYF